MAFDRRKFLRQLFSWLPKPIRFAYLRRAIYVSENPPPKNLEFKIAETKEELESAYKILHDSYVESGFQQPETSGLRIIKYFALPTTTTLIAKWDGKVVGTISIIRRGPFGLPVESAFDLQKITSGGKVTAEVSSLAISSQFRHRRGTLFLPMCKFFYLYVKKYMHLDRVVIAVNPAWSDFYEGLLDFSPLDKKVIGQYDFANGAPAVGLWSDVTTWEDRFRKLYNRRKPAQNFYRYFVETPMDCLRFPIRDYQQAVDPVMSPEMLDYFFRQKSWVFQKLSQSEILALHSCYPDKNYSFVVPKINRPDPRGSNRYVVHAMGEVEPGAPIRIIDASIDGLRVQGSLPKKTTFDLIVYVTIGRSARLRGRLHWIDRESDSYGVELIATDAVWGEYINHLKSGFDTLSENPTRTAK